MSNSFSEPSLLLIGMDSSLAGHIISKGHSSGWIIDGTSRRVQPTSKSAEVRKVYNLELIKVSELFNNYEFQESKYDKVVINLGATSISWIAGNNNLADYYQSFTYGINTLIQRITADHMREAANMIVIGSIAASRSSFDPHYSAVKSSLESFVRSYSKKLDSKRSIVTLSPSLIEDSKMYEDMDDLTRESHYLRSNNKLLSATQVANLIFALTPEFTANMNGRTLAIGNDY